MRLTPQPLAPLSLALNRWGAQQTVLQQTVPRQTVPRQTVPRQKVRRRKVRRRKVRRRMEWWLAWPLARLSACPSARWKASWRTRLLEPRWARPLGWRIHLWR